MYQLFVLAAFVHAVVIHAVVMHDVLVLVVLPWLFIRLLELCSFDLLIDEADQAAYTVVS